MSESPSWLAVSNIDLEDEYYAKALSFLEKEIESEYVKNHKNKALKLLSSIESLELSGDEASFSYAEKGRQIRVAMSLPLFDDLALSSISCSCSEDSLVFDPPRCHHMWASQYALKEVLKCSSTEALDVSDWKSFFEKAAEWADEQKNEDCDTYRIRWVFRETGDLAPVLQKYTSDTWSRGRVLSWKEFFESKEYWTRTEELLASHVKMIDSYNDKYQIDLGPMLAVFHKEADLYCEKDRETQIQIVESSFRIRVIELGDEIEVHGVFAGENDQTKREQIIESWGYFSYQSKAKRLYIEELEKKQLSIVRPFMDGPIKIPASEKSRLVSYLAGIEKKLLVECDDNIVSGKSEKANSEMLLRLTPFKEKGMKVELLVSPSSTKTYFVPASGPESVLEQNAGGEVSRIVRDFSEESAKAENIVSSLTLMKYPFRYPSSWILTEDEICLDFMRKLESQGDHLDLSLEWPKNVSTNPYERSEDLLAQSMQVAVGEKTEWFALDASIEIDGVTINLKEILDAIKKERKYLKLETGKWARITESFKAKVEAWKSVIETETSEDVEFNPSALELFEEFEKNEEITITKASKEFWRLKKDFEEVSSFDLALDDGFKATLRPYQMEGYEWLARLSQLGLGACLADDMGLGKTVQTLAVLHQFRKRGASLVVAPTSLQVNWRNEAKKFAPELNVYLYREGDRDLNTMSLGSSDVVLISYGLLLREASRFSKIFWNILVMDEAQNLKNARSQTSLAIQSLNRRWALALSGTPIENNLAELWSLFRVISPGVFSSWERFKKSYLYPIEKGDSEKARERLKLKIKPYILRRLKKDYLTELPEKTVINLEVRMSANEWALYDGVRKEAVSKIAKIDADKEEAEKEGEKLENVSFQVLAMLLKLRQASCHPMLLKEDWEHGSSKMNKFFEQLELVLSRGSRVLVFSQFTSFLKIVEAELKRRAIDNFYLDGQTPGMHRAELVERFQEGESSVFLISLKAGGTGLTLTSADVVFHLDPWWNPAVEDQATDRVYRMGQKKPVTIYRFVVADTVEEKIYKIHSKKRDLSTSVLSGGDDVGGLGVDELKELILS